jgi:hypothetical protein
MEITNNYFLSMFRLVFKGVYLKLGENWLGFEATSHHDN